MEFHVEFHAIRAITGFQVKWNMELTSHSGYEFSLNRIAFFFNETKPCFICIHAFVWILQYPAKPRFQESQFHAEYLV